MTKARRVLFSRPDAVLALLLAFCLCLGSPAARALAEAPVEADRTEYEKDTLIRVMNLNLRYILNDWWYEERDLVFASSTNSEGADSQLTEERDRAIRHSAETFAHWRDVDELSILYLNREQAENGIRPLAHAVYCISLALYDGYYNEAIINVSEADAEAMCVKLISAVADEHRSNHPGSADEHWGGSWQSALWAENIGLGAWLLREKMAPEIYEKVERMVLDEAHTLMDDYELCLLYGG